MMEHIWVDRVEHEQLKLDHSAMLDRIDEDEKKLTSMAVDRDYWMNVAANRQWQIGDLKGKVIEELKEQIEKLEQRVEDLVEGDCFASMTIQQQEDRIGELEQENETLKAELGCKHNTVGYFRIELSKMEKENETLKANLTEAEGRIRRLEDALSYWKAEYREAKGCK